MLMNSAKIIEETQGLDGCTIATVRTERGDEYIINADAAVIGLADLFSTLSNERRLGWELGSGWYAAQIDRLRENVLCGRGVPFAISSDEQSENPRTNQHSTETGK